MRFEFLLFDCRDDLPFCGNDILIPINRLLGGAKKFLIRAVHFESSANISTILSKSFEFCELYLAQRGEHRASLKGGESDMQRGAGELEISGRGTAGQGRLP